VYPFDKFTESLPVTGWSVKTDTGFQPVVSTNSTIEYIVWRIRTTHHELLCADFHILFLESGIECFASNLVVGDRIMTEQGPELVVEVVNTGLRAEMYDLALDDQNHRYYTNGVLSHNTTIGAYFLLYEACFPQTPGDILIVAHKQAHAVEVLKRIKDMYYSCPLWMKPGMEKNNETSVVFDNGMRIIAEATTSNAARGKSLRYVYCVDGQTKITIRNKITHEVREINIEELYLDNEYK